MFKIKYNTVFGIDANESKCLLRFAVYNSRSGSLASNVNSTILLSMNTAGNNATAIITVSYVNASAIKINFISNNSDLITNDTLKYFVKDGYYYILVKNTTGANSIEVMAKTLMTRSYTIEYLGGKYINTSNVEIKPVTENILLGNGNIGNNYCYCKQIAGNTSTVHGIPNFSQYGKYSVDITAQNISSSKFIKIIGFVSNNYLYGKRIIDDDPNFSISYSNGNITITNTDSMNLSVKIFGM